MLRRSSGLRTLLRQIVREELARLLGQSRVAPLQELRDEGGLPYAIARGWDEEQLRAALSQPFGLASRPAADMPLVLVPVGDGFVAVGAQDRSRPTLNEGEAALYSTAGARVIAKADGSLTLNDGSAAVARVGDSCSFSLVAPAGGGAVTGSISIATGSSTVRA